MSKYAKLGKIAKCGSVDSKYFNDSGQFEQDIQDKIDKSDKFQNDIRELILADPNLIEQRYHEAIKVLLKLKEEYEI